MEGKGQKMEKKGVRDEGKELVSNAKTTINF